MQPAQTRDSPHGPGDRVNAVPEVQSVLATPAPILDRLTRVCQVVADRVGGGIATVYLHEDGNDDLALAATSLAGGGFAVIVGDRTEIEP